MSAAVLAGVGAVTQISYAGSRDMYNTYDALAIAKRIPNDQAADPECAGVKVNTAQGARTGRAATAGGGGGQHAQHAGHGARSTGRGQQPGAQPSTRPDGQESAQPDGQQSAQPDGQESAQPGGQPGAQPGQPENPAPEVPARCHQDLGGPFRSDFVPIQQVRPNVRTPDRSRRASTGTFTVKCGRNEEGRHNTDNVIVAPGVVNGAHHTHDYVGNDSTSGASTDESLAAAGTTCDKGDLSTYYWPVLRKLGTVGPDADQLGGGAEGNVGEILTASSVKITFMGNPRGKVVPAPRFLRIITGDAKAFTKGPANANAKWSCGGFENRVTTKYPLCPRGSQVLRIADFQSCWDGKNTDSENHRSHIVFPLPDGSGRCPKGTVAVPQLSITLAYDVPPGPSFAVDGFPEEMHNPITDHNDFINVMPERLMQFATHCINTGRRC